jgi:hypothetical protein
MATKNLPTVSEIHVLTDLRELVGEIEKVKQLYDAATGLYRGGEKCGDNTVWTSPQLRERALLLARGNYQADLINGHCRWSGADLRGRASAFGARYARSRRNLIQRLRDAGFWCRLVMSPRDGRYRVAISDRPWTDERVAERSSAYDEPIFWPPSRPDVPSRSH